MRRSPSLSVRESLPVGAYVAADECVVLSVDVSTDDEDLPFDARAGLQDHVGVYRHDPPVHPPGDRERPVQNRHVTGDHASSIDVVRASCPDGVWPVERVRDLTLDICRKESGLEHGISCRRLLRGESRAWKHPAHERRDGVLREKPVHAISKGGFESPAA